MRRRATFRTPPRLRRGRTASRRAPLLRGGEVRRLASRPLLGGLRAPAGQPGRATVPAFPPGVGRAGVKGDALVRGPARGADTRELAPNRRCVPHTGQPAFPAAPPRRREPPPAGRLAPALPPSLSIDRAARRGAEALAVLADIQARA